MIELIYLGLVSLTFLYHSLCGFIVNFMIAKATHIVKTNAAQFMTGASSKVCGLMDEVYRNIVILLIGSCSTDIVGLISYGGWAIGIFPSYLGGIWMISMAFHLLIECYYQFKMKELVQLGFNPIENTSA